jgi:peptidoglycan hydrolase CwlO-like protein|tara:strand:- start:1010 stop:1249 length:240 start_codon:yes stop_codon:yes gene_type:complete
MEMNSLIFWNVILSLVYAPLVYSIRANLAEIKRIDILLSKTREEIPRTYVTKTEVRADIERILKRFDRLEEKIDNLHAN